MEDVLWWVLGCGCVLSLGHGWTCRHLGDLFSSPNSSTSPGGRGSSSCHTEVILRSMMQSWRPPPPELPPPPAASPAAAVEPGLAPDDTEAPPPLEEEPSLEPMLVPASEEELPPYFLQ
ncbi:hypothetical protein QTO34_005597 [Cnephaeus nilssonii]|uniref:Uncharacterized protein n=1 Tax=Cnephaeus nilssonii TaxID=3371016 RepID=A0AA40LJ39_CNENI|nr:hypothetical protein QTO34_005597 [Eptesicus nilssonii]